MEGSSEETDTEEFVYEDEYEYEDEGEATGKETATRKPNEEFVFLVKDGNTRQDTGLRHVPTLRQKTSRQRYVDILIHRETLSEARLDQLVQKLLSSRILSQLFRNIPVVKLEVLDKRFWIGLTLTTIFFYVVAVVNAVVTGVLYKDNLQCQLESNETVARIADAGLTFLLYAQLVCSALFYVVLLFLLISYPQRILVRLYKYGKYPTPEQQLLVILVIVLNITPGFNAARLVVIWQYTCLSSLDVTNLVGLFKCRNATTTVLPLEEEARCFTDFGYKDGGTPLNIASNVFSTILLATLSWSICTILNLQGLPMEALLDDSNTVAEGLEIETVEDRFESAKAMRRGQSIRGKVKETMQDAIEVSRKHSCTCVTQSLRSLLLLTPGLSSSLSISCLVYVVYQITVSTLFEYSLSIVPIISIVSIFRVCLDDNCVDSNGMAIGCCKEGTIGFNRAIATGVSVLFELVLFVFLPQRFGATTFRRLQQLPYAENRSKHLGFQLFKLLTSWMGFFIFVCAVVIVFLEPTDLWIAKVSVLTDEVIIQQSPLYFVGIDAFDPEFLTFAIVVCCWIFALCSAYLPADSVGFVGYFVGESTRSNRKKSRTKLDTSALPMFYIMTEDDFLGLLVLMKKAEVDASGINSCLPPVYRTQIPDLAKVLTAVVHGDIHSGMITEHRHATSPHIVRSQLQSRVICMETCLLLFNFSNATYYMQMDSPLEDNAKFIEDSRYRLIDVVIDKETDTCVVIAKGPDRIVLAFRGTVTGKNVKTDLNYTLCVHEEAEKLKETAAGANYAALEAQVHTGFMVAYTTVRTKVLEQLAEARKKEPNTPVMCCGHSLGGGLAALAAFDLVTTQGVSVINCTTFGCPKVGNAVFKEIYNNVIPNHFRFTLIRDVIPALTKPFSMFVYRHVGTEIVLDLEGKMVISPNLIERYLMLNFRRYDQNYHFMSRYALALLTWIARAHGDAWKPPTWVAVNNGITKHCRAYLDSMTRRDRKLAGDLRKLIIADGVEFTKDKVLFRDMAVQTDIILPPGVDLDLTERSVLVPRTSEDAKGDDVQVV